MDATTVIYIVTCFNGVVGVSYSVYYFSCLCSHTVVGTTTLLCDYFQTCMWTYRLPKPTAISSLVEILDSLNYNIAINLVPV